jgi:hypothetical protein
VTTKAKKLKADGVTREIPLARLRSHERYKRTITAAKLAALRRSLEAAPAMLWARPLIALPDGRVIAGNRKYEALVDAERDRVPVFVADLPDAEAEEWAIRDNRHFGEDDEPSLAALLGELQGRGTDLTTIGFEPDEYEDLLAATDQVPTLPPQEFGGGFAAGDEELARRAAERTSGATPAVKREVSLLLAPSVHKKLLERVGKLQKRYGTTGIIDTIVEAVRREAARRE